MNPTDALPEVRPTDVDDDRVYEDELVTLTDYRIRVPSDIRGPDAIPEGSLAHVTLHVADDRSMDPTIHYAVVDEYGRVTIPDRIRRLFDLWSGETYRADFQAVDIEEADD